MRGREFWRKSFAGVLAVAFAGVVTIACAFFFLDGGFITSVEVVNHTGQPLRIALLGVNEGGRIGPLHGVRSRTVPLPELPRFVELSPGETRSFAYDWDDINFCWIAVATDDGIRIQKSGFSEAGCSPLGTAGPCCGIGPVGPHIINDVGTLPPAPEAVREAALRIP